MKKITVALILGLFSLNSIAEVGLKFDFKLVNNDKTVSLNEDITANFDEKKTILIPDSNKIIEMTISEQIPDPVRNPDIIVGQVYFDIKIYENAKNGKTLLSSPKIVTTFGTEAMLEMSTTDNKDDSKNGTTSIKIIPTVL
jgi:hypothetical protein